MIVRAFEEEQEPDTLEAPAPAAGEEPEYRFEGYDVEFSNRILLTPAGPAKRQEPA